MKLLILVLAKPLFTFGTVATLSYRTSSDVGLIGGDAAQRALPQIQPDAPKIGPLQEDPEPVPVPADDEASLEEPRKD